MSELQENIELKKEAELAPFFIRLLAFIIDGIIIGIIGLIIGSIFFDILVQMTWKARFVGIVISLLYFTIMNSKLINGQTIGKLICKIKVVNIDGSNISILKSFLRAVVLSIAFFINGWALPIYSNNNLSSSIPAFLLFTIFLLLAYFYIFNKRTRQSLHDILLKTYVIKNNKATLFSFKKIAKVHLIISLIIIFIIAAFSALLPIINNQNAFSDFFSVRNQIEKSAKLYNTSVFKNTTTQNFNGEQSTSSSISVATYYYDKDIDKEQLSNAIADIVINNNLSTDIDKIYIKIIYGFDIGIAKRWIYNSYNYSVDELKKRNSPINTANDR